MIGNFADMLLFRSPVDLQLSFKTFLAQVKENVVDDYLHGQIPSLLLKKLLKERFGYERSNFYKVVLNVVSGVNGKWELPGMKIERIKQSEIGFFPNREYLRD